MNEMASAHEHTIIDIMQEHSYAHIKIHPITGTTEKYIVGDRFHDSIKSGHKKPKCKYHNIDLCPELKPFQSVTSEVINGHIKSIQLKSSSQQNIRHFFIYNRLMDYWHNRTIIQKQFTQMTLQCKENEYVTRDHLHRFVYRQK